MFVNGIGTANPEQRFTKADCLEAFQKSDWFERLDVRSRFVARTVLQRDNGIEARRLALANLADVFAIDPNTLSKRFYDNAPRLAAAAAIQALQAAKLNPRDIDAVIVSTCTGYMCPGLSGYVVEGVGLRSDVKAFDLVGQGCAGALPNLQLAHALLSSIVPNGIDRCENVLSICVEVSSAAMYLDDDPGVIISACLFGDGAGAAVLSRNSNTASRLIQWVDSSSLIDHSERKALMFEQRDGMLRNILTRPVPALAAQYARQALESVLVPKGLVTADISAWILHAGGRDVLQALEQSLEVQAYDLRFSAAMLREYGNMSSAFVYFVLEAALADHAPDGWWWLSSFGAGFSCHGALLKVGDDEIW
ncbi:stilbene synthase (plasmid) [Burkholderia sp. PAMC 28687]|uniref:3-oxoacyl-[acyl-carrier-protein] synthase III C-terminal domain-containing protein n=1 Tax=Burkholderia sp. PAMC 28687 TaxID=1795874 RepID=UPI000780F288|nr:3-oxoacyl-[acyl-carrier-protein] synthase III C-terminal domain-containing protein [Burkholderia sp. PAMC 28687]AMM18537.1 stilbene synthase [Burkholderia sp. PAMC 28687]